MGAPGEVLTSMAGFSATLRFRRKQRAADSGLRLRRIRETGMHRIPNFCFTAIRFRCRDLIFTMKNA